MMQPRVSDGKVDQLWSSSRQVEEASGSQTASRELLPNMPPGFEKENTCKK
jgi:hypothetical protein